MAPRKKKEAKYEKFLKKIYCTPKESGSFGGIQGLKNASKQRTRKLKTKQIVKWLSSQDTYTLHKPVRQNFHRSKVVVGGIDIQWQADLVDVSSLASKNQGMKYLLTCIDVFSKYAWVEPLCSKTGKSLGAAFTHILSFGRKPIVLQTDQGKEFVNGTVQGFFKKEGVDFFTTYNEEIKAYVVERFNRTLKTKMWKYFTKQDTKVYIDVLDDLVESYNDTFHHSIKMKPTDVNMSNQEEVWHNLYGCELMKHQLPNLKWETV